MQMPLAASYLGFNLRKDKINKDIFYGSWFKILADIYEVSRDEIEERDKKRQARRRRMTIAGVAAVILILSGALIFSLISRNQAVRARDEAERRYREALSRKLAVDALSKVDQDYEMALLLSLEALRIRDTAEARKSLFSGLSAFRSDLVTYACCFDSSATSMTFSPDGKMLISGHENGKILQWIL